MDGYGYAMNFDLKKNSPSDIGIVSNAFCWYGIACPNFHLYKYFLQANQDMVSKPKNEV